LGAIEKAISASCAEVSGACPNANKNLARLSHEPLYIAFLPMVFRALLQRVKYLVGYIKEHGFDSRRRGVLGDG
jgi:hypothetical protein